MALLPGYNFCASASSCRAMRSSSLTPKVLYIETETVPRVFPGTMLRLAAICGSLIRLQEYATVEIAPIKTNDPTYLNLIIIHSLPIIRLLQPEQFIIVFSWKFRNTTNVCIAIKKSYTGIPVFYNYFKMIGIKNPRYSANRDRVKLFRLPQKNLPGLSPGMEDSGRGQG